jgi:hypothetical protein
MNEAYKKDFYLLRENIQKIKGIESLIHHGISPECKIIHKSIIEVKSDEITGKIKLIIFPEHQTLSIKLKLKDHGKFVQVNDIYRENGTQAFQFDLNQYYKLIKKYVKKIRKKQ